MGRLILWTIVILLAVMAYLMASGITHPEEYPCSLMCGDRAPATTRVAP